MQYFLAIGLLIFPQSTRRPSCLVSSSIFLTIPDAILPHFCDSFLPATSSFRPPLSFVLTNTYHQPEWGESLLVCNLFILVYSALVFHFILTSHPITVISSSSSCSPSNPLPPITVIPFIAVFSIPSLLHDTQKPHYFIYP